ncbi:MAG: hypothetical protein WAP03_19250 [Methylorubrum rhodinum]|uniref:hypothetical protein n=1 Tax=Methylorubrum rhodinum TaxID=29428 RepID=UPI003BB0FEB4
MPASFHNIETRPSRRGHRVAYANDGVYHIRRAPRRTWTATRIDGAVSQVFSNLEEVSRWLEGRA